LIFWATTVVVPLIVLVITVILRHYKHLPHTAATDVWAFLVALDAAMALDSDGFTKALPFHDVTPTFILVWGVIFIIICSVMWLICLLEIEPAVMRSHTGPAPFPYNGWLFAWATLATVFAVHVALFTGNLLELTGSLKEWLSRWHWQF
jgi:hypothetical protein